MMTNPQIALIRDSWSWVAPSAATVGPAFYHNLFIIDPSLRPLFPADMHEQARKLMAMLSLLVGQLENSDGIVSELTGLARRHVRYGVRPEHYVSVGEALMQTLRDGLGPRWTPDLQMAWEALYQTVSAAMITLADGPGKNHVKPVQT